MIKTFVPRRVEFFGDLETYRTSYFRREWNRRVREILDREKAPRLKDSNLYVEIVAHNRGIVCTCLCGTRCLYRLCLDPKPSGLRTRSVEPMKEEDMRMET